MCTKYMVGDRQVGDRQVGDRDKQVGDKQVGDRQVGSYTNSQCSSKGTYYNVAHVRARRGSNERVFKRRGTQRM